MVKEKKTPKIRPEYRVVSSGALDLANFAGEIVSNPDTVLVSLAGSSRITRNSARRSGPQLA